jgi:hypothetical protein
MGHGVSFTLLVFTVSLSACSFRLLPIDGSSSVTMALPDGAVLAFDSATCPDGWSDDSSLSGRVIVGKGIGNTDVDGNALTSRALDAIGGLEYTSGIPAYSGTGNTATVGPSTVPAGTGVSYLLSAPGIDVMGTDADANFPPFIVRHYCKKDDSTATLAASAVMMFNSASCGTSFSADTSSAGRVMLGEGAGNNDARGAPLTSRTFGDTGGFEVTVLGSGLVVDDDVPGQSVPSPNYYFSDTSANNYSNAPPDTTFGGTATDSNMPPFVVLTACEASTEMGSVQSGAVVAFDLSACPTGWSVYSAAVGRVLVSSGSGSGLTARALGATGGHEYTIAVPAYSLVGNVNSPVGTFLASLGANGYSTLTPDTTIFGAKADSNMPPFQVLLYCEKD